MVIYYAVLREVVAWVDAFAPPEMITREQCLAFVWHVVIDTKAKALA